MDTVKDAAIQMIHDIPNSISVNNTIAELYFREKVNAGLNALDDGRGIGHQEAKDRVKKWLE